MDNVTVIDDGPSSIVPAAIGRVGKIGGSVYYRRGHKGAIGRTARRAKERAQINQGRQVAAVKSERSVREKMRQFENRTAYFKRKYGLCSQCTCIIAPQSLQERAFLDACLTRGDRCQYCVACFRKRRSRVARAKFAILKRRGKNPRIVNNTLVTD